MAMELVNKVRQEIVEDFVSELKSGKFFLWENPNYARPYMNYATGNKYRGGNIFALMLQSHHMGYQDNRWITNKQAKDLGLRFKQYDSRSRTGIEYWRRKELYYDENGKKLPEKDVISGRVVPASSKGYMVCKYYTVYNAEEFENFPEQARLEWDESMRHMYLENGISQCAKEVAIKYDLTGDSCNCYRPLSDSIHFRARDTFKSVEDFYYTAFHEIAHSTGHESRLNREALHKINDSSNRAFEELVAELASVFVCSRWGLAPSEEHKQSHTAYFQSWISELENDPNVMFSATAAAEKAADYIEEHYILKELPKIQDKGPTESIKLFMEETYPDDEIVADISPTATFTGLWHFLQTSKDNNVYHYIFGEHNGGGSTIRENVFLELANRLKVDYNTVYTAWLNLAKQPDINKISKNTPKKQRAKKQVFFR